jgi:hypothetical protein
VRAVASLGGDVWGCGRWRYARPGLADAAGGVDAAGVMRNSPQAKLRVLAVSGPIERNQATLIVGFSCARVYLTLLGFEECLLLLLELSAR